MRSLVVGSNLAEGDSSLVEGDSTPLVVDIRRILGEVVASHNHHIHLVEAGTVPEEEEYCIAAYLATFLAISLRIHDFLTTTVAVADHIH